MADNPFKTFPSDEREALAMLYVQSRDLSSITPEELFDLYDSTYSKIKAQYKEKRNGKPQRVFY